MKAYVIYGKHDDAFIEVPKPEISGPMDVLVKVKSMGICGTDIHIFEGEHSMSVGQDRIPGHEFAGVVEAVGEGVTKFKVGDRVVHEPISFCGKCYACRKGQGNVCRHIKVTGCNMSGGCEEYWMSEEKQWHKIPDWMTWKQAALVEPYTIGAQVNAQAKVTADDIVLVHGGGPIGLMCMDTAKHFGAKVFVSEIMPGRIELAKKMGADAVINPKEENLVERVMELTDGLGPTVILDCVGLGGMMDSNFEMLQPAGTFVPVATAPYKIEKPFMVMSKQLTIIGSRLQWKQFEPVIARFGLYAEHANMMVTDTFPFEEADKAFRFAAERHPETGKVVILFDADDPKNA